MNVHDVLRTRAIEIDAEIEALKNEQTQIAAALAVLENERKEDDRKPLTNEQAIVEAVRKGQRRPQDIHKFLTRQMRMKVNIGSLRSTLSRLKKEGKINHDNTGWVM